MTRVAIIHKEKCNPVACGNYLCARLCPVNRTGSDCIIKGEDEKALIIEELCTGCGICPNRCPFGAIDIVNLPEALQDTPMHRYNVNAFELFHLPIPKKGIVVGILGRNGIGKSTALNILSGNHLPNLGHYHQPPTQESIEKQFSNTIIGDYLKQLYKKEIKISFKPQRIELLPKLFQGKVKDLIKKVDEKNISKLLIDELELNNILDRNIADLSGGELQRLAILACCVKKADFYFFDEPASFLDVTSRIKAAKIIKSLANENTSVMVVEHDLATLDYISDEIQIIYGHEGVFGIVSQSKSVRRGINEYLDGFLPDDNIRFRNYSIKFFDSLEKKRISKEILFEFDELEKSYKDFKLKVNPGNIRKGEVLAVMGENGLGKTTFLKLLANLETPDKGNSPKKKVTYKTQYPSSDVEGTVMQWIAKTTKEFTSGWYQQNIIEKLGLLRLLNNKISELSGGELQKVYIAITLSQEADIYAFDEPSAFIDVEDRLKVAEVIKEFMTRKEKAAIVVDHDVQFVDYIADSILIFEGIPGKEGHVYGPCDKEEGMNRVLKLLDITYRKDKQTNRPRINKPGSQLDSEQRALGKYYYSK